MDKVKISNAISVMSIGAMSILGYNSIDQSQSAEEKFKILDKRVVALSGKVDTLYRNQQVLASSILYLDSCQNFKESKMERAERRGRFLGGLIKGILPKF
jgi:hypothetical protein